MNNIKRFRTLAGMKQTELAQKLGISRGGLILIEGANGSKDIRKTCINGLCEIFNTTPVMILGEDNFRYVPETKEEIDYMISLLNLRKERL